MRSLNTMYLNSKYILTALVISLPLIFSSSRALAGEPILFGIMSLAQPSRIHKQWQPFVEYVSKKSGHEIKIVIPRGFKKIKKEIANKKVDMFYTNSFVFYRLNKAGKADPLAQMQNLDGNIMSNSVIFTRSDSGINNLKDMKSKNMAFVSPAGAGGYLAPRALFNKEGIDTKKDLNESFTKNLTSSLHKVLLGDVNAATMCGLNFKLMSKKIDTGELKVIATSEDYPENIIGVRPDIPQNIKNKIADIVFNMPHDDEGKKILSGMKGMKIKSFVKPSNKTLQRTKELIATAKM